MATDLVEIDPQDPQPEALERAAAAVRRGLVWRSPPMRCTFWWPTPSTCARHRRVSGQRARIQPRAAHPDRDSMMAEELASELTARFFILARRSGQGRSPSSCRPRQDPAQGHRAIRDASRCATRVPKWLPD